MEPEVLHRSDASQNDHKSKGYLHDDLKRLGYPTFIRLFKIRLNNSNQDCAQDYQDFQDYQDYAHDYQDFQDYAQDYQDFQDYAQFLRLSS